jgi:hypothetical protein
LPTSETALQIGDLVNISATFSGIKAIRAQLGAGTEA